MEKNKITLTTEQMRQLARYEITFKDILKDEPFQKENIVCPQVYHFTLDDLYAALKELKEANPALKEFGEYWYDPLTKLSASFGIDRGWVEYEDYDDIPDSLKGYPGLNVSDNGHFDAIWWRMDDIWEYYDDEERMSDAFDFDENIEYLDRYYSNKGKPIEEWVFSDVEKERYIGFFDEEEFLKKTDEARLSLARKFIDELCEKDSGQALYMKGYACYGGNRLYSCDWKTSRDCMLRLFDKKDDPQYANTLGYIYYYGRCNGGVPEYDKAFYYFGIAAANGLYEGMYKLADMFRHGYACKQSSRTARTLYEMVYQDSLKNFLRGDDASFADAALRMGNVNAKGIDADPDPIEAWYYYVQAFYAARLRAQESDFFGNTTVVFNVQKAMDEIREQLPEYYLRNYMEYQGPYHFNELIADNNRCELSKHTNPGGYTELTAKRTGTRSVPEPEDILITIPQISFCARTDSLSYIIDDDAEVWFKDEAAAVRFDYCAGSREENRFEFWYDEELVAWVRSKWYRFYGNPPKEISGPEYRIVSIRFNANGRSYDYICEDPSVQVGDTVIVAGYDGETEVEVLNIVTKHESELALPVERYKKILRKVGFI